MTKRRKSRICALSHYSTGVFLPAKQKKHYKLLWISKHINKSLFLKNKEIPSGLWESEKIMLRICLKAIKQKGSTVVHLQYRQSSARWHPNYINSCLFCVLRHKTWLQIDRKVRGKTALSSKLQTVFNWIQADNRAKVHLPGFPTPSEPPSAARVHDQSAWAQSSRFP